jgi:hypothetical protein
VPGEVHVPPLAHIGNIPVEEWLPFVVPVLAIYVYVRRRERRRRADVERLIAARRRLDERLVAAIVAEWTAAKHSELTAEHVPLLAPPGPNGATPGEIAGHAERDEPTVRRLLGDLADLGYVEEDVDAAGGEAKVWLTAEGFVVANIAENVLLAAFADESAVRAAHAHG